MRKITLLLIVFILTGFAYAQSGFSSDYPSLDKASITSLETRVAVAGIPGETCENPINIASLPYTTSDNTSNYGNNYTGVPGSNCGTSNNFLTGDDVVYEYTAISNTTLNITMTPMVGWTGIFVYTDCANINTACVAGVANSNPTPRVFDLAVTNGTTYYFLISGSAPPQSIQYTLIIKDKNCTAVTANFKVVNDCNNSGGFFIDVNVTAMGSATNLTISDDEQSRLVMVEGGITGILSLKLSGETLKGFWISPDGARKLNVNLMEVPTTNKAMQSYDEKYENVNYEMNDC